MQPLSGLKVIEFCRIAAGPFAGRLLADMIKVEALEDGGTRSASAPRKC